MNEKQKQILIIVFISCIFLLFIGLLTFFIVKKKYHENYERSRTFRLKKKENLVDNKKKLAQKKYTVNVINMDKDANRLEAFNKLWDDFFFIQRFPAVKINSKVNKPHNACGLSHYTCALNYFEQNPNENIAIVMEDDSTPFNGLDLETLNEYLDILKKNSDSFDVANLGPYIWEKDYQPKKKCVVYSQAPEHYTLVYNGYKIMNTHFVVYSRSTISLFKKLREYSTENMQFSFVIDRIFNGSSGSYTIPFIKLLVPNVLFAFQEDYISNHEDIQRKTNNAIPSVLNTIHKNNENLWKSRLSKEFDMDHLEYFKRNSLMDISQENSIKAGVTLMIPINFDLQSDYKKVSFLEYTLRWCKTPIILLIFKNYDNFYGQKEKLSSIIKKNRFSNWPISIEFLNTKSEPFPFIYDFVIKKNYFNTMYYYWFDIEQIESPNSANLLSSFAFLEMNFFPSFYKVDRMFFFPKKNKNSKDSSLKNILFGENNFNIVGNREGWYKFCNIFNGNTKYFKTKQKDDFLELKENVNVIDVFSDLKDFEFEKHVK
jgi:hypothetical protein